jgi:hypothetical protein
MTYDLEVLVPVCGKYLSRFEDFKKYGLVNIKERKIRVNLVISGEDLNGLELGWDPKIEIRCIKYESTNYVGNLYRFYLDLNPDNIESRWIIRLDDDSCTDIDGLLSNLDLFYDCDHPYHLGKLNDFKDGLAGNEGRVYLKYKHLMQEYENIAPLMKNEVECGITSRAAIAKILKNERSFNLLKFRSELEGGYGDCVLAIAAAMAKVYPIDCPFLTEYPLIEDFSLLGGVKNHIHMICRTGEGENFADFDRVGKEGFELLMRVLDNDKTEIEKLIAGKRYMLETPRYIRIYEFFENFSVKGKPDDNRKLFWYAKDDLVLVMDSRSVVFKLRIDGESLVGENLDAQEEWEEKVSFICIGKVNKPMMMN